MEKNKSRLQRIEELLTQQLEPKHLEVHDESHLHIGHAGAKTGLGHFAISIVSEQFSDRSPIQIHRMIYEALGTMMTTDIHALRIIKASAH